MLGLESRVTVASKIDIKRQALYLHHSDIGVGCEKVVREVGFEPTNPLRDRILSPAHLTRLCYSRSTLTNTERLINVFVAERLK